MRRDTYLAGEITEGSASRISKTIKDALYRMKLQEIDWGKHSIERPVRPTPVYFDVTGHEVDPRLPGPLREPGDAHL